MPAPVTTPSQNYYTVLARHLRSVALRKSLDRIHVRVFSALVAIICSMPGSVIAGSDDLIFSDGFEPSTQIPNRALRYFGNGINDIDRVKIRIDDPATSIPGPPVDVGAADFTIEVWLRATAGDNSAAGVSCGNNNAWISGNVIIDRDRFNQGRIYGLSLAGRRLVWGVGTADNSSQTICGATIIDDGLWHHVAVQRRIDSGEMTMFVDGVADAQDIGPSGDISYPDDGVPGPFCDGPCTGSDPFIVLGAEKHDAGSQFPSYAGEMDELRFSSTIRYSGPFIPPDRAFETDATTVGLYHFDAVDGSVVFDDANATGGPSHGGLRFGGNPAGPIRVISDAPTSR